MRPLRQCCELLHVAGETIGLAAPMKLLEEKTAIRPPRHVPVVEGNNVKVGAFLTMTNEHYIDFEIMDGDRICRNS